MKNDFSAVREAERIVNEYLKERDTEKKKKRLTIFFAVCVVLCAVFFTLFLKF